MKRKIEKTLTYLVTQCPFMSPALLCGPVKEIDMKLNDHDSSGTLFIFCIFLRETAGKELRKANCNAATSRVRTVDQHEMRVGGRDGGVLFKLPCVLVALH